MAAKPSTAAEKALQKIQDQVTCGICLEPYKQPRLLKCFHVYCEQCLQRLETKADLYCETCDELICRDCIVRVHRDHQYDLVPESFAKQEKVIVDSLKPVEEQIATLERAVESVNTRCAAVVEQKTAVVAEIRTAMAHLRQALEARETELVGQAEQTAQQKLKTLAAQRDGFELQLGQLRSCQDFVEESRRTCRQGEILRMKSPIVKQVNDLTGSFKPETLALAEQADMVFAHSLPELVKTCQRFGKVYCSQVCPEKCRASGEGIKVAMRGQIAAVSVEALDREGEAYLRPVGSLRCELVACDGSSRVRGTVKRRNRNIYDISYQPQATGELQLHVLIEEHPILNSPFTVTVLPNFTAPANIIGDLNGAMGYSCQGGRGGGGSRTCGHCVSIISGNGEKKSFGTRGSGPGQFDSPKQLSSTGKHLRTVGTQGSGPLQFQYPEALQFILTLARIQVFTVDGVYLRQFGKKGEGEGELNEPVSIAIDSGNVVYVGELGNNRISIFSTDGEFIKSFGRREKDSGSLLSGCNDKMLRVFDLSRPDSDPQLLAGSSSAVKSAVWTREPAMLSSCCEDKDITIELSHDRQFLTVAHGSKVTIINAARLWDTRTGGVAKTLVLESPATSIELSHDRQFLTVAHGSKVTIINAARSRSYSQYTIYYTGLLLCVLSIIHWAYISSAVIDFFLTFLVVIQLIVIALFFCSWAARILKYENILKVILYGVLLALLLYFFAVTAWAILRLQNDKQECTQPQWLLFSASQLLVVQLFFAAVIYISRKLSQITTARSNRLSQKAQLWGLVIVYQLVTVVTFSYDLALLITRRETMIARRFSRVTTRQ
ncbi:E3 ubiquitin-protein ligase TRIM71 [Geodia barretti]|uniref:E3 ubiquitin-protein ligase TRIM71 n=1 Tax=Geodia barretti TaxID=519541 RepID=A0AA35TXW8_GEOBA|nr:E3 ubiquitin-protein ligase TRIM71 [Geodia barretti]